MFFYALDVLQHSVQTTTRGAVYSCHFSLESQREHAEEVARCSSEVFLEICYVWSSLQNLSSVYCNLENIWWLFAGLRPSVCWQQFNWMILILWTLIGSNLKWSSGANNRATRRSYLAPKVVCQTELRENYTRVAKTLDTYMSIFNHSIIRFALFIYFRDGSESRVFTFSHFSHKIWVSQRFPYVINR